MHGDLPPERPDFRRIAGRLEADQHADLAGGFDRLVMDIEGDDAAIRLDHGGPADIHVFSDLADHFRDLVGD